MQINRGEVVEVCLLMVGRGDSLFAKNFVDAGGKPVEVLDIMGQLHGNE
jgi:hypothetical protein